MLWKDFFLLPNAVDQIRRAGLWTTGIGMLLLEEAGLWKRAFVVKTKEAAIKKNTCRVLWKRQRSRAAARLSCRGSGQWMLLRTCF